MSLIGDGGFIYGCPVAALWSASAYHAPFLTVVCNNQSYLSIRELLRSGYSEESVSGELGFEIGTDIRNPPDFASLARACHAYGEKIEDPSGLLAALKNALGQVHNGTPAVLDVKIR